MWAEVRWEEQGQPTELGSRLRSEGDPGRVRWENKTFKGYPVEKPGFWSDQTPCPLCVSSSLCQKSVQGWRGLKCLPGLSSPRLVAKARPKAPALLLHPQGLDPPLKISWIPGKCNSPVPKYSRQTTILCKVDCELFSFLLPRLCNDGEQARLLCPPGVH